MMVPVSSSRAWPRLSMDLLPESSRSHCLSFMPTPMFIAYPNFCPSVEPLVASPQTGAYKLLRENKQTKAPEGSARQLRAGREPDFSVFIWCPSRLPSESNWVHRHAGSSSGVCANTADAWALSSPFKDAGPKTLTEASYQLSP